MKNESSIDSVVLGGDGEETLRELMECLIENKDFTNCLSIACRVNKEIRIRSGI